MQRTCGSCTGRPPASASTTRTCWKTCCRTALRLESLGGEPPSKRLRLEEGPHAPPPKACEPPAREEAAPPARYAVMPVCKSKGASPLLFMGHTRREAERVANTSGEEGPAEAL